MKKRFTALLSLLVALVMCFSFVACGSDNGGTGSDPGGPGGGETPTTPSAAQMFDKATAGLTELAKGDGFKGAMSYTVASALAPEGVGDSVSVEKRGDMVKVDITGGEPLYIDTSSGYVYGKIKTGKSLTAYYFPLERYAAYLEYFAASITPPETELPGEDAPAPTAQVSDPDAAFALTYLKQMLLSFMNYDDATKTLSLTVDVADTVNVFLDPLQSAYKANTSLKGLINNYIRLVTNYAFTYDTLMASVANFVIGSGDSTCGEILTLLNGYGVDVIGLLEQFSMGLSAEQQAALNARTVREAVYGLNAFIAEMSKTAPAAAEGEAGTPGTGEGSTGSSPALEMLSAAAEYIFFAPVELPDDPKGEKFVGEVDKTLKAITSALELYKFKDLIDGLPAGHEAVTALITTDFDFEKLSLKASVTFGDNDVVTGVEFTAEAKHDYVAPENAPYHPLLGNNNFKASVKLAVSEYLSAPAAFELPAVDNTYTVMAFLPLYGELADVNIEIDNKGIAYDANSVIIMIDDVPYTGTDKSLCTLNNGTGALSVKKELLENCSYSVQMVFPNTDGGHLAVTFVRMPETVDDMINTVMSAIKAVTPDNPPVKDPSEGPSGPSEGPSEPGDEGPSEPAE